MTADVIKFRLKQRYKLGLLMTDRDILILREDGNLGFVPKGTVLSNRIEDGPPEVEYLEDLQAGARLARQAAEQDD